jgi:hypothetical protein
MTVPEVQAAAAAMAELITQAVQTFETNTGCIVHSLPVLPATKTAAATVQVKVQIP